MARKINDYLSTFFPAEALNEANQQARFQYDYPNLSQQMTHNQYAAPYQQFQQEYPQLEQYARDVLSGRIAKQGLQELSSNLNQAIQGNPQALEPYLGFGGMTAFHGSPHKFSKFMMDKIGTGEGAQAYGHGLYFAESPGVAKSYSISVPTRTYDLKNSAKNMGIETNAGGRAELMRQAQKDINSMDAAKQLQDNNVLSRQYAQNDIAKLIDDYRSKGIGHLYEVDIPDEQINKMLDWDAPLSEQPESVRKMLKPVLEKKTKLSNKDEELLSELFEGADDKTLREYRDYQLPEMTGKEIYQSLVGDVSVFGAGGKDKAASEYLNSLGIPGIKYFDQASRGAGEGTRNFVVFDEDIVKILDRK